MDDGLGIPAVQGIWDEPEEEIVFEDVAPNNVLAIPTQGIWDEPEEIIDSESDTSYYTPDSDSEDDRPNDAEEDNNHSDLPQCRKGKPCGLTCIAKWKTCHIDTDAETEVNDDSCKDLPGCHKGEPCGLACIAKWKTCHKSS